MSKQHGELSKNLLDKLTEIICVDVGSKILDGVTYIILSKSPKDKAKVERYNSVRRLIDSENYAPEEIFRIYEVANGYIYDIDMNIAKMITTLLAKLAAQKNPELKDMPDLIGTQPDENKDYQMKLLAKKCLEAFKNNQDTLEIALFSRNKTNKIILTADGMNKEKVVITYPSFALRPWDLEEINVKYLIERGMRISGVKAYEIIGNNSGLRVSLTLGKRVRKS